MADHANDSQTRAAERRLEWALEEGLGGRTAPDVTAAVLARHADGDTAPEAAPARSRTRWLWAAAVLALGVGVLWGVGQLDGEPARTPASGPRPAGGPADRAGVQEPAFVDVRSVAEVEALPLSTRAVRCFDFDDAKMASLARLANLQRLDLSAMDTDERGVARSVQITDAGILHLAGLTKLQSLDLSSCQHVRGHGLAALARLPMLRELDVGNCVLDDDGAKALLSLRGLVKLDLASNGWIPTARLLELPERLPGLEWLSLAYCPQVTDAVAVGLARLRQLRHVNLWGCNGQLTFQVVGEMPVEGDGVGVADGGAVALAALPRLEVLLLGVCRNIGAEGLAAVGGAKGLRELALASIPNLTNALLAELPAGLETLDISDCAGFGSGFLEVVAARCAALRSLNIGNSTALRAADLEALSGLELRWLGVLGCKGLAAGLADALGKMSSLEGLELASLDLTAPDLAPLGRLPRLTALDLSYNKRLDGAVLGGLAGSRLESLNLNYCAGVEAEHLAPLHALPLARLELYRTGVTGDPAALLAPWPGVRAVLANGRRVGPVGPDGR